MDAFENLIALLLRRDGYWTATSVKVKMSAVQKRAIGRPSSPRWEIDLVAYKGSTNELLVVECKSFLDSYGVTFRKGSFEPSQRYKLFTGRRLREIVLKALASQLVKSGACAKNPKIRLCLATGKIATRTDRLGMRALFDRRGWRILDEAWIGERLAKLAHADYENDVSFVVAKILRHHAGRSLGGETG